MRKILIKDFLKRVVVPVAIIWLGLFIVAVLLWFLIEYTVAGFSWEFARTVDPLGIFTAYFIGTGFTILVIFITELSIGQ
jgi:hypothetical protein